MFSFKDTQPIYSGYIGWCKHNKRFEAFSEEQAKRFVEQNPEYKLVQEKGYPFDGKSTFVPVGDDKHGIFRMDVDLFTLLQQFPPCSC